MKIKEITYSDKRIKRVNDGIEILEVWINDLIKEGIISLSSRDSKYFKHIINILDNYDLKKVANRISKIQQIIKLDSDWTEKVQYIIGDIYLLIKSYKNIDNLPEDFQIEVRTKISWGQNSTTVINEPIVKDNWFVVGQKKVKHYNKKSFIFTYLLGEETNKIALIIQDFNEKKNNDKYLNTGFNFKANIKYYPRLYKLKASYNYRNSIESFNNINVKGFENLELALKSYSDEVIKNPWLNYFPLLLEDVSFIENNGFFIENDGLHLIDKNAHIIPVEKTFKHYKILEKTNMTRNLKVFGEWNGQDFLPLTIFTSNYFISFYNTEDILSELN